MHAVPASRFRRLLRLLWLGPLLVLLFGPLLYSALRPILAAAGGVNWTAALGIVVLVALAAVERSVRRRWIWVTLAVALMAAVAAAFALFSLPGWNAAARLLVTGAAFVGVLAAGYGEYVVIASGWRRAEPELDEFGKSVLPGLRLMRPTVIGFGLAYLLVVLWFAYLYDTLYWLDPEGAFKNAGEVGTVTFLYFSLLTITTLGYTEIMPTSFLAQLAVSVEVLFGIAWTLIVFAVTNSQVVQGSEHVSMTGTFSSGAAIGAAEMARAIRDALPQLGLDAEDLAQAAAELATIDAQLASPRPKVDYVRESFKTLRSLVEGVASNAAAAQILPQLGDVLRSLGS